MSAREWRFTIITGPRDAGKTRTISRMAEDATRAGLRVGGVIAEARFRDGVKDAYSFVDIATGERRLYAVARGNGSPGYDFRDEGIDFGCAALRRAIGASVDALFVDEVGPLEMAGGGLWEPLAAACAVLTGSITLTVRPSLLDQCISRLALPAAEVRVIRVPVGMA